MSTWISRIMRQISYGIPAASRDTSKSYEEAVRALNTLQSNAAVLAKAREEGGRKQADLHPHTVKFAERAGVTLDDLDRLSIIHVSGTKGKGSTCAFTESILRSHGFKTGFYSSPHLVEVRERIRVNGRPLSKDAFSTYFWDCYKNLESTKDSHGGAMPAYFRFLTIMAFHVFLQEQVDVAIIEVGIGGQYDCTNIIRSPVVCGVSSLGYDHLGILGPTIDRIAWNKAGIFKQHVPAITVPQPENSIQVIIDRAKELGAPLYLAPKLKDYDWQGQPIQLGIPGDMQRWNASLAMQLCNFWLNDHPKSIEERKNYYKSHPQVMTDEEVIILGPSTKVEQLTYSGLSQCRWAGRNQTLSREKVTYYLDGAHTLRSVQQCVDWFLSEAGAERDSLSGKKVARVLLFNTTGDRKPESLMEKLLCGGFDCAVFCPNIASLAASNADQTNFTVTVDSQLSRCISHKNAWLKLTSIEDHGGSGESKERDYREGSPAKRTKWDDTESEHIQTCNKETTSNGCDNSQDSGDHELKPFTCKRNVTKSQPHAYAFDSIQESLLWTTQGHDPNVPGTLSISPAIPNSFKDADHIQVLCTGSLHLIGGVLKLIDPDLNK